MDENRFYRKIFHTDYPAGTLAAIFSKRPINAGQPPICQNGRCRQQIGETILYSYDARRARFKDSRHHVLIIIADLDRPTSKKEYP